MFAKREAAPCRTTPVEHPARGGGLAVGRLATFDGVGDAPGVLDGPLGAEEPGTVLDDVDSAGSHGLLVGAAIGLATAHVGHGTSLRLAPVWRLDVDRAILQTLS